jgi:geranylgeranyl reductase family protein
MYDVIIIGAGPAGATAARQLAKQHLTVLLLEKSKLPRYKPCGGGLTNKALEYLDFDISSVIEAEPLTIHFSYDSGATIAQPFTRTPVACVMRDKFDYLLTQKAVEAGAQLREGVKVERVTQDADRVTVHTAKDTYHARFVVGADGATGVTAKSVGLMARRHDGAALEGEIHVPPAIQDKWQHDLLLDFGGIPWGYAWIFPKGEHLSIGIGTYYPSGKIKLREYLDCFIAKQPDLREHGELFIKGHLVPLGGRMDRFAAGRVVVAGDAAAMADPFLGEGISHSIRSGQLAAAEITQAIQRGDANLARYTQRLNREIHSDFRYARLATQIFYRWPRFTYHLFIQSRVMLEAAATVVEGKSDYRALVKRVIKNLPRIVWHALKD